MSSLIPKVIADLELQIASAIGIGDTSFTLNTSTDDDGVAIPAGVYCFTVDNGTSNKEYLIGQVNGTAVTSVKSVSRQGAETTGALKKHRIGAPIILTDFAAIQRVVDILKGVNTLDGANPVSYGTEPTLSDRKELATVGYVLDAAFGGSVTFDSQVITNVNAGESVVLGDLVYFKTSDQEWYKVDADDATTVNGVQLGIAKGSGSDGVAITGGVQLSGVFTTSGLTAGSPYYASDTAGGYTLTPKGRPIGFALSATRLLLGDLKPNDNGMPVGSLAPFAGSVIPKNFLLCDGAAISRALYSNLFNVLGTAYGVGDGSTTFNLPNLKGRVPVGFDSAQTEFDALGETGGAKTHTLTTAQMPAHAHNMNPALVANTATSRFSGTTSSGGFISGTQDTSTIGSGEAHNNLQPYITLNYIIKAL